MRKKRVLLAYAKSLFKVFTSCVLLCKSSCCKVQSMKHGTRNKNGLPAR